MKAIFHLERYLQNTVFDFFGFCAGVHMYLLLRYRRLFSRWCKGKTSREKPREIDSIADRYAHCRQDIAYIKYFQKLNRSCPYDD